MTARICKAKGCFSHAMPGSDLCGFDDELAEDGAEVPRKPRQNRKRLEDMTTQERADAWLRVRESQREAKRRKNPNGKHSKIVTESVEELAELYTTKIMRARAALESKQSAKEAKAERVGLIREGLAQRKTEAA